MVNDQQNTRSVRPLLIFTFVALIVAIAVAMLYLSAQGNVYGNTEPYVIQFVVEYDVANESFDDQEILVQYDYGYGFNKGHEQTFLLNGISPQLINHTVSAWKQINSLRLMSTTSVPLEVRDISITKSDLAYEPESLSLISLAQALVVNDVHVNLIKSQ